jgi:uncharacterized membrane protein YfbV (UPF0208 family)
VFERGGGGEAYSREVFDVAVSSVLWTPRYGSRAFAADFLLQAVVGATRVNAEGLWWMGDLTV